MSCPVVIGLPRWSASVDSAFAGGLADRLRARDVEAQVLLTGPDHGDVAADDGDDARRAALPVPDSAGWGARWGALIAYLESRTPCIYVPVADWQNSVVSPKLSDGVAIAGFMRDDPRCFDEAERLGRYWNAILAVTPAVAERLRALCPETADRIVALPPDADGDALPSMRALDGCAALFEALARRDARTGFRRPYGLLRRPPFQAGGMPVLAAHYRRGIRHVGLFPSYRDDYEAFRNAIGAHASIKLPRWSADLVDHYPAVLGVSGPQDAANARFVTALAEGLQRIRNPAQVLLAPGADAPPIQRWPGETLDVIAPPPREQSKLQRVDALAAHLESHAPCLFLPSAHALHQAVCASLSERIAVIGRIDALPPRQVEWAAALAAHWDAIVAGSDDIADQLVRQDPGLAPRVVTISLPPGVPARLSGQPLEWGAPLRVAWREDGDGSAPALAACMAVENAPIEIERVSRHADPAIFDRMDTLVVLGEPDGGRQTLLDAMRHGCVPVLAGQSGDPAGDWAVFVRDGENGYRLPAGDLPDVVARLSALQMNPALRRSVAAKAYETTDVFLASYAHLFERVLRQKER
jgi:hypothetical protein